MLHAICMYTVSQKNDTALACYNFDEHQTITFGTNVAKSVSSQIVRYFFTSLN